MRSQVHPLQADRLWITSVTADVQGVVNTVHRYCPGLLVRAPVRQPRSWHRRSVLYAGHESRFTRAEPLLRRAVLITVVALWAVCALAAFGLHRERMATNQVRTSGADGGGVHAIAGAESLSGKDRLASQLSLEEPARWVTLYNPERASNGYTLVFYRRRMPLLIDMNGVIVHSWPTVRGAERMRLERDGSLLIMGTDNIIRRYDWDGRLTLEFGLKDENHFPHHDVRRTREGNFLLVCRDNTKGTDYLLEVDRDGRTVWEWRSTEYLSTYFPGKTFPQKDKTHINSVQELPSNRLERRGDDRFKPGNLLVSARNLNTVFVVEKKSGKIVWRYEDGLDHQHEALMIEEGIPGAGNILLFNNGLRDLYRYRRSRIEEIDPSDGSLVWHYESDNFFASVGGVAQRLHNGNTLVTSTSSGRMFEIDSSGEIVWQWVPPFKPMRPERYPYDFCPQLEGMRLPGEAEVVPTEAEPYIDTDLYRFGLIHETSPEVIRGKRREFLKQRSLCRRLLIPAHGTLHLDYGLDESWGRENAGTFTVSFLARIRGTESREEAVVLDDTLSSHHGEQWRSRRIPLDEYAHDTVHLCLEARVTGDHSIEGAVRWENPVIRTSELGRGPTQEGDLAATPEAAGKREATEMKKLQALGYVD